MRLESLRSIGKGVSHRRWRGPLVRAAVLMVILGAADSGMKRPGRDPLDALLAAASGSRPTPSRLTRLPYAPFAMAHQEETMLRPDRQLLAAVAHVQREAKAHPTARTFHALGIAYLVVRQFAHADQYLRRARQLGSNEAIDNDLAAALIGSGLREQAPGLIAEGLEILILQGHNQPAESLFNQALGLEALGLPQQALTKWRRYLEMDSSSGWAAEAHQHILDLQQRVLVGSSRDAENDERAVLDSHLPAWAEATLAGRAADTEAALTKATAIASGYKRRYHDNLLMDIVLTARASRGRMAAKLAIAYLRYAKARQSYRKQRLEECRRDALDATQRLTSLGHAAAQLAALTDASCAYLQEDLEASEQRLRKAIALAHRQATPSVLACAQMDWLAGLLAHARARPLASLRYYDRALSAFQSAGDEPREARVHSLLADLYDYLGQAEAAWQHATLAARSTRDAARRYQALASLVRLASSAGFSRLAALLANASIVEAMSSRDPIYVADAQMVLARVQAKAGDRHAAITTFERALTTGRSIPNHNLSRHALAYGKVELAATLVEEDPARAAELVNSDLLIPTLGEVAITAASVRAESARRFGLVRRAESELRAAIEHSRRERGTFTSLSDRDLFFSRREALHHQLVRLLADAGRNADALDVLELWRSEASGVGRIRQFQGATSIKLNQGSWDTQGQQLYAFLALPEEFLAWRLSPSGIELTRHPIGQSAVRRLVQTAVTEIRSGKSSGAAARLSRLLFGDHLDSSLRRLIVAPDATVFEVPFGALATPSGNGPLVANFEVEVTPSLSLWKSLEASMQSRSHCALLIKGASSGGSLLPGLRPLTHLSDEVRTIEECYQCITMARTLKEIRTQLVKHPSLIHYAGHALSAGRVGASLLLDDGGQAIPLEAPEIEQWDLRGATVILSSCSGADGRPSALAGRDGLARAFLAAGARSVIANLWPVDDESAFEFARELHQRLNRGESIGRALNSSQRALVAYGRPPASWGGWMLIGAG